MDIVSIGQAVAQALKKGDLRYIVGLVASGDTTGATDLANAQGLINITGRCRFQAGQSYYLNGALVLPSNCAIEAYGAVLHGLSGGNIIRTASALPTRTVTDAVATAGNATLTSATANFTTADIGSSIGIVGAGAQQGAAAGATWYGKITAVASTTSVTISIAAATSVSAARADIFATRTSNIIVSGGVWSIDVEPANGHVTTATYLNALASAYRRVDGLTLRDQTWTMVGTKGQGGKFSLSIADATGVYVDGIRFTGTAGDGLHFTGPISNVTATHITGSTGDDMVVLNNQDSNTPFITDTEGAFSQVLIRDVLPQGSLSAFKLYDIGAFKRFPNNSELTVENVRGSCNAGGVQIGFNSTGSQPAQVTGVRVTSVHLTVGSGSAVSTVQQGDIVIEDVAWLSTTLAASAGIVNIQAARGLVDIRSVRMGNGSAPSGTNIGVLIGGQGAYSGGTFGETYSIDGVYNVKGPAVAAATFHGVVISSSGSSGTMPSMRIANAVSEGTTGSLYVDQAGIIQPALSVSRSTWTGTSVIATASSINATTAKISDVIFTGTSLITALCPVKAKLSNIDSTNSAALVAVTGANGSARVTGRGIEYLGSSNLTVSRDASQVLSVNGAGLLADLSLLTPVDGDQVYNTNAALASGIGLAIYNAGAGAFVTLANTRGLSGVGARANSFDATRSLYNWKPSNTYRIRAALADARAGTGLASFTFGPGDSKTAGLGTNGGVSIIGARAFPRKAAQTLADFGIPTAGTGHVTPGQSASVGLNDQRWIFDAAWNRAGSHTTNFASVAAAGKVGTFTSDLPGTVIELKTFSTGAAFTITVDGAAPTAGNVSSDYGTYSAGTFTPGGSSVINTITIVNQTNASHVVAVTTTTASNTFVLSCNVRNTSGVQVHNFGLSGSNTSDWVNAGTFYLAQAAALSMNAVASFISLGTNDASQGVSIATYKANMSTLITRVQSSSQHAVLIVPTPPQTTTTPAATWATFVTAMYDLADLYDLPLIDLGAAVISWTIGSASGLYYDALHENDKGYLFDGRIIASALLT